MTDHEKDRRNFWEHAALAIARGGQASLMITAASEALNARDELWPADKPKKHGKHAKHGARGKHKGKK